MYIRVCACAQPFGHIRLFATLWTVPCQAPLTMRFQRQECQSGLPFPIPGDLPEPGIESKPLDSLPLSPLESPIYILAYNKHFQEILKIITFLTSSQEVVSLCSSLYHRVYCLHSINYNVLCCVYLLTLFPRPENKFHEDRSYFLLYPQSLASNRFSINTYLMKNRKFHKLHVMKH